jgi:6-phosphogluconolactonase
MHGHNEYLVYVGSAIYEHGTAKNIYAYRFDASTGNVASLGVAVESINPGGLVVHPNGRFLYSTNEVGDQQKFTGGGVTAYAIDRATGKLTVLNKQASGGANPSYVVLDKTAKYLLTSNYYGGTVVSFPVHEDGSLGPACSKGYRDGSGPNKTRQDGPHLHSVYVSPDNRFVIAPDLGQDKVLVYRFDAKTGALTPNDPPFASVAPGAGSRHLAFSRDGKFIYVMNELQSSITTFSYDAAKGALHDMGTISALPPDFKSENTGAEIAVSNSGQFLYSSNRGLNSIAVFSLDTTSGKLTPVEQAPTTGQMPRAFALDPTGGCLFAANQDSNNIVLFRVDSKTGRLTRTGPVLSAISPTFVAFVPL